MEVYHPIPYRSGGWGKKAENAAEMKPAGA